MVEYMLHYAIQISQTMDCMFLELRSAWRNCFREKPSTECMAGYMAGHNQNYIEKAQHEDAKLEAARARHNLRCHIAWQL